MRQSMQNPYADTGVYLDGLDNSAEDVKELKEKIKNKATKGDKIYLGVVGGLCVAVLVFIAVFLHVTGNWDDLDAVKTNVPAAEPVENYDVASAIGTSLTPTYRGVKFPEYIQKRFQPIYSANEDTIGWIRLPGTSIDYPVMQGPDNKKYERANFYLESDHRGSIWMDYRNNVGFNRLTKNTIIYGHHLTTDECIFAELENYMDVAFYKQHPVIEFDTLYNNYKWKVFACFVSNTEPQDDNGHVFYYWDPGVSDENTPAFVNEILSRSWFINPAVDIRPTDFLLCLSTCTYMMNKPKYVEMRCVVMARLTRADESETVDVSGAYQNENRRMPQLWYTQNGLDNPYKNVPVFNEFN